MRERKAGIWLWLDCGQTGSTLIINKDIKSRSSTILKRVESGNSLVNGNNKLFLLTSTRSSLLVNTQFSSGKVSQRLWNVVMLSLQIEHTQAVNGGDEGGALRVVTMKKKEMECTWSMKLCHNRQTREKHKVPRSYESGILDNIAASAEFMTWDGMWVNMRAASCWRALPEVEHFTLWGSIAKWTQHCTWSTWTWVWKWATRCFYCPSWPADCRPSLPKPVDWVGLKSWQDGPEGGEVLQPVTMLWRKTASNYNPHTQKKTYNGTSSWLFFIILNQCFSTGGLQLWGHFKIIMLYIIYKYIHL